MQLEDKWQQFLNTPFLVILTVVYAGVLIGAIACSIRVEHEKNVKDGEAYEPWVDTYATPAQCLEYMSNVLLLLAAIPPVLMLVVNVWNVGKGRNTSKTKGVTSASATSDSASSDASPRPNQNTQQSAGVTNKS